MESERLRTLKAELDAEMENYFLCVAKGFENAIERDRWHKDLVKRMSLEIEGVRPALLETKDIPLIDDLRAFRHVFRNIYQGDLDTGKLKLVDSRMPAALRAFKSAQPADIAGDSCSQPGGTSG